jgi:hypothetical protein
MDRAYSTHGETRKAYKIGNNIKMYLREIGCEAVNWLIWLRRRSNGKSLLPQ